MATINVINGGGKDWITSVVNVRLSGNSTTDHYSSILDTTDKKYTCYWCVGGFRGDDYTATIYIQGSNDGSSWSTVQSVAVTANRHSSIASSSNAYRYYRARLLNGGKTVINGCMGMIACSIPE